MPRLDQCPRARVRTPPKNASHKRVAFFGAERRKLVEFFRGVDTDPVRALRVSRYVPEKLVRFSVWDETGTVRAAVSLDEDEASRLAEFVAAPTRKTRLIDDLRSLVRR